MTSEKFLYEDFTKFLWISRETFSRLEDYVALLRKWQKTINLISATTLADIWVRHIIDSAQLIENIKSDGAIVDLGSGAGLPGLVLAIMGVKNITLVESDGRKVAFLREAARVSKTDVTITNDRVENIDLKSYSLILARGFAPLAAIIQMVGAALSAGGKLLLLKGKSSDKEIADARAGWSFDCQPVPSITSKESVILIIENLKKGETHA
jgi:16S rRNA (guanine527-N7)-methyltransferase